VISGISRKPANEEGEVKIAQIMKLKKVKFRRNNGVPDKKIVIEKC